MAFSYNAKAVDGQLCLEASPNENQTFFAHSPHATLLEVCTECIHICLYYNTLTSMFRFLLQLFIYQFLPVQGVYPVVTTSFRSVLQSLGGAQVHVHCHCRLNASRIICIDVADCYTMCNCDCNFAHVSVQLLGSVSTYFST